MPNHTIIKLRRGTAAEWSLANEILRLGEPGFEKDTYKLKIGNGITPWNDLPYINGGFGGENGPLEYIYNVNMNSDDTINPTYLGFDSRNNYIDYSNFFNEIITNKYNTTFKLTHKNDPNNFLVISSDNISRVNATGNIDAFWPSSSIKWIDDGGSDQYDRANYINNNITHPLLPNDSPGSSTLREISIPYNSGRISTNSNYWGSNSYVTLYKKNIFAMVAYGNATTMPNTVFYAGNVGADGDGDKDIGTLTNFNGYQAGYCRIWGDDPTFTKLIITKTGTVPSYSTDSSNDTNDDLFVASGINSDTIAMVVFYAADESNPSSVEDIQTLFESFVTNTLIGSSTIQNIKDNFYNNHATIYDSVDSAFWYANFNFFTGTNAGSANYITAEGGSGSGLEFTVTLDEDTNQYVFAINNPGSNYANSDVVVLRGDNLLETDGKSPDEDIYIQIDSVGGGGEVTLFSPIIYFGYAVVIDKILVRSDGFRFVDDQTYYLNIDIIGGALINNPLNNAVLTSDGTINGINAEQELTFDGDRLRIDCACPSGTAGLVLVGNQRSTNISSIVYSDPIETETEDGLQTTRHLSRLILSGTRGTASSPSGLQTEDIIGIIRADGYNPHGTLNANNVLDNRTARIRALVSESGTHYLGSSWEFTTSSGGSGLYDQSMIFDHTGSLKINNVPILENVVFSDTTGITGASGVNNIVVISSANYDAIAVPDPNTLYFVV